MGEARAEKSTLACNTFVGRERELAELRHALDDVPNGRGRMFLLSGEPGIGKTRLAEEIAREATAHGMRTVWGRCWEGDGAPAYWPWIQVIRGCISSADEAQWRAVIEPEPAASIIETVAQIVPELRASAPHPKPAITSGLDPEQAQFQLFDAVATLLKNFARLGPLAIVLDDLHDADYASLKMLRLVARDVARAGILIVCTYRELEVQRSPDLSKRIGDIGREASSIPLTGLSQAEVAQLVELRSGQAPDDELVSKIHAETAGNPLFVDGIARMLIAARAAGHETESEGHFKIPHTVREAIRRRLAVLSEEANSMMMVAAAIGNEFDADVCMRAAGISRDAFNSLLDQVSSVGIAIPLGQCRYRFSHALIRGALYDALDTNTRIQLHGMIAVAIEEIRAQDLSAHAAELAHHFREAGASEKAIEYSCLAARAASKVFAYAVAATHWREALAQTEGQKDARRADILFGLGKIAAFHLDQAKGIARLVEALSLYRELKNEEKVAATNAILGLALMVSPNSGAEMNVPRALEYFRRAQAWKGEWTDLEILGQLHQGLAFALFAADQIDEAMAASKQAMQTLERASNPAWVVVASIHAMLLVAEGRHGEAEDVLDDAASVVQEAADPEFFGSAMLYAGWCRNVMSDPIEAKRFLTMGLESKGLSPLQRESFFAFLAMVELMAGDLCRAKAIASEHSVIPPYRSQIALREGDWEAATEMNLPMLEWARRTGHRFDEAYSLSVLFQTLHVVGELERAAEFLQQTLGAYHPSDLLFEMFDRPSAALLAIEMGRLEEANQHLEVCRTIIAHGEDWRGRAGPVARAEGMLASAQGRDFATHFEQAIAIAKRYTLPWDEADTLYDWGIALNKAGNYSDANEKFDAAIEIYRRHGAGERWIDRATAAKSSSAPKSAVADTPPSAAAIFRREGEFWTIAYQGSTFRLKDIKGLAYITYLIARPGQRFHVHDLIEAVEGSAGNGKSTVHAESDDLEIVRDIGGTGATIDGRARSEYRARLRDLQIDLDEAERMNDLGRCEGLRGEIEMLGQQLTGSSGLGGHGRNVPVSAERARGLVGKNIRSALDKIRDQHPALGRHFAAAISTGYFCSYQPDPDHPISWQL